MSCGVPGCTDTHDIARWIPSAADLRARSGEAAPTTAPPPAQTLTRGAHAMTDPIDTPTDAAPAAQPDPITDPPAPADIVEAAADAASRDAYGAGAELPPDTSGPAAETLPEGAPDRAQMIAEERAAMKAEAGAPMSAEQLTEAVLILAGAVSMQRISAKVRTAVSDIAGWPRDGVPSAELADTISAQSDAIDVVGEVAAAALLQGDARDALADGLADQLSRAQALGAIKPGQVITEAVLQSVSIDAGGLGTIADAGTPVAVDLELARWEPSDLVAPGQPVTFGVLAHRDETIIRPKFAALLADGAARLDAAAAGELEEPLATQLQEELDGILLDNMVAAAVVELARVYGPADDWPAMARLVLVAGREYARNGR